jgi:hypothetical protein
MIPKMPLLCNEISEVNSIEARDSLLDMVATGGLVIMKPIGRVYMKHSGTWEEITSDEDLDQLELLNEIERTQDKKDPNWIYPDQFRTAREILTKVDDKALFVRSEYGVLYLYGKEYDNPMNSEEYHLLEFAIFSVIDKEDIVASMQHTINDKVYKDFEQKVINSGAAIYLTKLFHAKNYNTMIKATITI